MAPLPQLLANGFIPVLITPRILVPLAKEYIRDSGTSFGDRFKEHLKAPSPIHHHSHTTGHPVDPECCTIVDRESPEI